jgi:hypothetical protein
MRLLGEQVMFAPMLAAVDQDVDVGQAVTTLPLASAVLLDVVPL